MRANGEQRTGALLQVHAGNIRAASSMVAREEETALSSIFAMGSVWHA